MLCWYYKWKISSMTDQRRVVLPRDVAAHIQSCPRCRQFYTLCRSMEEHDEEEIQMPTAASGDIRNKITQYIFDESVRPKYTLTRRSYHRYAAAVLLVIAASATFIVCNPFQSNTQPTVASIGGLNSLSEIGQQWIALNTESPLKEHYLTEPYRRQIAEITQSGHQAAQFMFACLNAGLRPADENPEDEPRYSLDFYHSPRIP